MPTDEIKAISEFIEEHGWNVVEWDTEHDVAWTPIFNFRSWIRIDDSITEPRHTLGIVGESVMIEKDVSDYEPKGMENCEHYSLAKAEIQHNTYLGRTYITGNCLFCGVLVVHEIDYAAWKQENRLVKIER